MQHLLGFQCVGYVEIEEYCQKLIRQRQEDGLIDRAPIFTDINSFVRDGYAASYTGMVDVITGGFPCQDISCAGKGAGITGERSGLWSVMADTIRIVRPSFAFVENSPMLTVRGLGTVLRDLAEMGFDARWCVLGAVDAGAPHRRERIWILAHAMYPERWPSEQTGGHREQGSQTGRPQGAGEFGERGEDVANAQSINGRTRLCEIGTERNGHQFTDGGDDTNPMLGRLQDGCMRYSETKGQVGGVGKANQGIGQSQSGLGGMVDGLAHRLDFSWPPEPAGVPRVATGIQNRVARLKAIGNGQVPQCAALAWRILNE